jgi:hypothetical protein
MRVFVTKYALTLGIYEAGPGTDIPVRMSNGYIYAGHHPIVQGRLGIDCFETREEAERAARQMALKKIDSLKRTLSKLVGLSAEPKWRKEKASG